MVIFQVMVEAFSFVDPDVPPNSQSFKNLISLYATELTFTIAKFWQMPTEILDVIEEQTSGNTRNCVLAKAIYDANIISELKSIFEANIIHEEEYTIRSRQRLVSQPGIILASKILDELIHEKA